MSWCEHIHVYGLNMASIYQRETSVTIGIDVYFYSVLIAKGICYVYYGCQRMSVPGLTFKCCGCSIQITTIRNAPRKWLITIKRWCLGEGGLLPFTELTSALQVAKVALDDAIVTSIHDNVGMSLKQWILCKHASNLQSSATFYDGSLIFKAPCFINCWRGGGIIMI